MLQHVARGDTSCPTALSLGKKAIMHASVKILALVMLICGTSSCCDMKFAGMEANSYAANFNDAVRNDITIKHLLSSKPTNINWGVWADACGNVSVQLGRPLSVQTISHYHDGLLVNTSKTNAPIDASSITPVEVRTIAEIVARYAWVWDYRGVMTVKQVIGSHNKLIIKRKIRTLVPNTFTSATHSFNPLDINDHD